MADNKEIIQIGFNYNTTKLKDLSSQIEAIQKNAQDIGINIGNIKDIDSMSNKLNSQNQVISQQLSLYDNLDNKLKVNYSISKENGELQLKTISVINEKNKAQEKLNATYAKTSQKLIDLKRTANDYINALQHYGDADAKAQAQALNAELQGLNVTQNMSQKELEETSLRALNLKKDLGSLSTQARATGKSALSFTDMLKSGAKSFVVWMGLTGAFFAAIRQIKDGISTIKDLDDALLELRKVTDLNADSMGDFVEQAQEVAQVVGRTSVEVTNATADFARMGFTISESLNLAEQALILTNIGDGIDDVSTASTDLIAILKGFNFEANQTGHILDALNEVSNKYAVNTADLADGAKRAGATLAQSGTTFEETLALLTSSNEVLQNMEKSSTGLITISQRIRGVKEAMEEGEDFTEFSAKLAREFDAVGVSLTDVNGNMRSTYDIIADLSKVWKDLLPNQRTALSELVAGKRQVTVFNSIMQNSEAIFTANSDALNSMGSALQENQKYLDSISGKVAKFNEAMESMWTNAINSESIKLIVDFGTAIINLVDDFGLLNTVIIVTAGLLLNLKAELIGEMIGQIIGMAMSMGTLSGAMGVFNVVLTTTIGLLEMFVPFLLIGGAIYFIKRLKKSREELDKLNESVKDASDEVRDLNKALEEINTKDGVDRLNDLKDAVEKLGEAIDIVSARERIQQIDDAIASLGKGKLFAESKNYVDSLEAERAKLEAIVQKYNDGKKVLNDYNIGLLKRQKIEEEMLETTILTAEERKALRDAGDDDGDDTEEEVKTLQDYYDIIRQIAESEYQMDLAEGTDAEAEAIKKHIPLLEEYNRQMQEDVDALEAKIDRTDGITGAEIELAEASDELTDKIRDNNLEIKSLNESYLELTDTFEQERQVAIDSLEEQKSLIEGLITSLDEKQDRIEKEREETEKLKDIQEKLYAVEKAREELANVQNERNTRMLTSQGFQWMANPSDVAEAQANISSAESDLADSRQEYKEWLEDERIEKEKEALEEEITIIENAITTIEAIEGSSYDQRISMLDSFIARYNSKVMSMGSLLPLSGGTGAVFGSGEYTNPLLGLTSNTPIQPNMTSPTMTPAVANNTTTGETKTYQINEVNIEMPEGADLEEVLDMLANLVKQN